MFKTGNSLSTLFSNLLKKQPTPEQELKTNLEKILKDEPGFICAEIQIQDGCLNIVLTGLAAHTAEERFKQLLLNIKLNCRNIPNSARHDMTQVLIPLRFKDQLIREVTKTAAAQDTNDSKLSSTSLTN